MERQWPELPPYVSETYVPGEGPRWATMAFVGEAPGEEEDLAGRPFIGAAGRLLTKVLARAGLKREHVYITNVFKHRPERNNILLFYEDKHMRRLRPEVHDTYDQLIAELQRLENLEIVVLLGTVPLRALFGKSGITKYRGSPLRHPAFPNVWFLPTYHPAFALRKWVWTHIIAADIQKARDIVEGRIQPHRPRNPILPSHENFHQRCLHFLRNIESGATVVCDVEVIGQHASCIVLATSPTECCVVPFYHEAYEDKSFWSYEDEKVVWGEIIRILEDENITKVFHNAMFDVPFLLRLHNIRVRGPILDTMIMHHDVYPELPKGLDFLTSFYLAEPYYKDDLKIWRQLPGDMDTLWEYTAKDGLYTYEAFEILKQEVKQAGVQRIVQFDHSLIEPLTYMSVRGFRIDRDRIEELRKYLEETETRAVMTLQDIAGWEVNPRSPQDIRTLLYTKPPKGFGFEERYNVKSGSVTTDEETITHFIKSIPDVRDPRRLALQAILDARRANKLRSTYIEMRDVGGRVLTSYRIGGTFTGRLSSSRDIFGHGLQMQNIPKHIRAIFVPDPGRILVQADLSQAEARVVAALAQDDRLLGVFESGGDIHRINASNIFNKPVDQVTDKERQLAKRVVHASNYDMGWRKLSIVTGIPAADAKILLETYHNTYLGIRAWHRAVQEELARTRTLWNPFGRRYVFLDRWGPELFRAAYAAVPQGTVADLLNQALLKFYRAASMDPRLSTVEILTQVHDSIVFQVSEDQFLYACQVLKRFMEMEFKVPSPLGGVPKKIRIPADFEAGYNWGPYDPETNPKGLQPIEVEVPRP